MTYKTKIAGPLILAGLIAAVVPLSAQAGVKGIFTAGLTAGGHTESIFDGQQYGGEENNYIELEGQKGTCEDEKVTFTGSSATGTDKTLTVTADYKDCKVGGMPATINMNGCDYLITQPTKLDVGEFTSKVDLECDESESMVIQVFLMGGVTSHSFKLCEITIGPAEELGHIILLNEENGPNGKDDITVKIELEKINYERHGACGTTTVKSDGKYVSSVTMTASSNAKEPEPHDFWISEEGE